MHPHDINLLNEARENLEALIDKICYEYNFYHLRTYRRNARKDYLNLAKCKKRTKKKYAKPSERIENMIQKEKGVCRDFSYTIFLQSN